MPKNKLSDEFNKKLAPALKDDEKRTKLNGFIKNKIQDQPGLLDCLWVFTLSFDAEHYAAKDNEKHRGLAIQYALYIRAIELAEPINELADFVLYVAALSQQGSGIKWDTRGLHPPTSEHSEQYRLYQSRFRQMPDEDHRPWQRQLIAKAKKKRQNALDRRTLITEVRDRFQKLNGRSPTLEELFNFDPVPDLPRKNFDKMLATCDTAWSQFGDVIERRKPATEDNLNQLDKAFKELRQVLLDAGDDPPVFYQMWKWIREGREKTETIITKKARWVGERFEPRHVTKVASTVWDELYLEACFCALLLAHSKWNMFEIQRQQVKNKIHPADREFLLNPLMQDERINFEMRLRWGLEKGPESFNELHRVRRRMNRFGAASSLQHLDELDTVTLANKIAEIQKNAPQQIKNMIVESTSNYLVLQDKYRIGQAVLDEFTIIWLESNGKIIIEFHKFPYQLFSTTSDGLATLVQKALWRKMRELSEQLIAFLLVYLEFVGLAVDVVSAGTASGFRRMAFAFIKEQIKDRTADWVTKDISDAFHIDSPALQIATGISVNMTRMPGRNSGSPVEVGSGTTPNARRTDTRGTDTLYIPKTEARRSYSEVGDMPRKTSDRASDDAVRTSAPSARGNSDGGTASHATGGQGETTKRAGKRARGEQEGTDANGTQGRSTNYRRVDSIDSNLRKEPPHFYDPHNMAPGTTSFFRQTAGAGGIKSISFLKDPDGLYSVKIKGTLEEPLYRGKGVAPLGKIKAPDFNKSKRLVTNKEAGLNEEWENLHLWGPGFGDEAAAGIMKGPRNINQWYQNQGIEGWMRDLRELAIQKGGRVEVEATAIAWDLRGQRWQPKTSPEFLRQVEYRVELKLPNQPPQPIRVTIEVDLPPSVRVPPKIEISPPGAFNPAYLF